jgi:hypothetical protein
VIVSTKSTALFRLESIPALRIEYPRPADKTSEMRRYKKYIEKYAAEVYRMIITNFMGIYWEAEWILQNRIMLDLHRFLISIRGSV